MAYEIVMPQLSDSMEEGKLISWKVKAGQTVKSGDVIAEVESDKAIMEVQSFKNGVVSELLVKEGDEVPVGTVIARIEVGGSKEQGAESREEVVDSSEQGGEIGRSEEVGSRSEKGVDSSEQVAVSNEQGTVNSVQRTVNNEKGAGSSEQRTVNNEERKESNETVRLEKREASLSTHYPLRTTHSSASPKAKALAARYGLDIEALQEQGKLPTPAHEEDILTLVQRHYFTPKAWKLLQTYHLSADLFELKGKISEKDVMSHIEKYDIPLPKPLSANQKAVIATVTAAAAKPVYHLYDTIDAILIHAHTDKQRTVTVWLLKLFAEAMMKHEVFRTTLKNDTLQVWPHASVSVAMASGEALYMPVVKKIDTMDMQMLADTLDDLKSSVRSGRISAEQMQGSTFGLSNLGMTGIERFDAMVNGNDAGIAAIGSEKEGRIAITLTLDHRLVNGYQAAEFMQTLKALCQDALFFKGI